MSYHTIQPLVETSGGYLCLLEPPILQKGGSEFGMDQSWSHLRVERFMYTRSYPLSEPGPTASFPLMRSIGNKVAWYVSLAVWFPQPSYHTLHRSGCTLQIHGGWIELKIYAWKLLPPDGSDDHLMEKKLPNQGCAAWRQQVRQNHPMVVCGKVPVFPAYSSGDSPCSSGSPL